MKKIFIFIKKNITKIILTFILLLSIIILAFNFTKIVVYKLDNLKTKNLLSMIYDASNNDNLKEIYSVTKEHELKDNKKVIYYNNAEDNYYVKKFGLINVNYTKIKKMNSDMVGWIKVMGTKIDYPLLQSSDNEYYLNHSFDKKKNMDGWVYLDYRNKKNELSDNNIIYAHSLPKTALFSELTTLIDSDWVNNKDNYIIYYNTDFFKSMWEIVSIYTTKDKTNLGIDFKEETFNNFLNKIKKQSIYKFDNDLNGDDKILTLSACYDDKTGKLIKMVVHAKLIKISYT